MAADGIATGWVTRHHNALNGAYTHPFILQIQDGTVTNEMFNRVLPQHRILLRLLEEYVNVARMRSVHANITAEGVKLLGSFAETLDTEIDRIEDHAWVFTFNLDDDQAVLEIDDIRMFFHDMIVRRAHYTEILTVFWAIFKVITTSFSRCSGDTSRAEDDVKEFCERWGYTGGVDLLQILLDTHLAAAPPALLTVCLAHFQRVIELITRYLGRTYHLVHLL